jgi:hypothetical protein
MYVPPMYIDFISFTHQRSGAKFKVRSLHDVGDSDLHADNIKHGGNE